MNELRRRLLTSPFRARFRLHRAERVYYLRLGAAKIRAHAEALLAERLAPAEPLHDGRQTPMRGHPVFVAQHACACCCRSCLAKWHGIPVGRALSPQELAYVVDFLMGWLEDDMAKEAPLERPRRAKARRAEEEPRQGLLDFGEEGPAAP